MHARPLRFRSCIKHAPTNALEVNLLTRLARTSMWLRGVLLLAKNFTSTHEAVHETCPAEFPETSSWRMGSWSAYRSSNTAYTPGQ